MADRVPAWFVELAVGLIITGVMTLLRIILVVWTGDRAPYAFVFVAIAAATVLAGWRSGLLALILGQLMAWALIIDPAKYAAQQAEYVGGFVVATFAQLVVLAMLAIYQREIDRAWRQREAQVDLVHQALAEIDHRTSNNYQTVLALVLAQAKRADPPVKAALQQVADRITAIATTSRKLSLSSESLEQVRVADHLRELCDQIEQGLSRPGIALQCEFENIVLGAEEAIRLSILVNELVTNALKHAFPDNRDGVIHVTLRRTADGLDLGVEDNGVGMKRSAGTRGTGLGNRLIDTFVKQLSARHQVETGAGGGTKHHIQVPLTG